MLHFQQGCVGDEEEWVEVRLMCKKNPKLAVPTCWNFEHRIFIIIGKVIVIVFGVGMDD